MAPPGGPPSGMPPMDMPLPTGFTIPAPAMKAVVCDIIFTTMAFAIVCTRIGTRTFMIKNLGLDDYLIIVAMIGSVAFLTTVMLQIKAGLGRQVLYPELAGFLQALWATIPIYSFSLAFCKLSITVQCYRVLRTPKMQKILRVFLGVLVVYGLWAVLSTIFNCWPVSYYWTAHLPGSSGSCMDRNAVTFANAGLNIVTDLILLIVPVPLLWRLQIPKKQKIVLLCVFGAGTLAVIMSIVRLQALYQIGMVPPSEQSIQGVNIAIWSCIEINVGIMCASVPALKPLVVKIFPKMLLSDLYARTKGNYYGKGGGNQSGHLSSSGVRKFGGNQSSHIRSTHSIGGGGLRSGTHTNSLRPGEIQVEHSFEMKSVPMTAAEREIMEAERNSDHGKGGGGAISSSVEPGSRDGSEKDLVVSSWLEDEYYRGKKVTITGQGRPGKPHPREIV